MSEKGILGVKKDPKKQILFSFRTREGEEWPSDDSNDSDYCPDNQTNELINSVKTIKKRKSNHNLVRKTTDETVTDTSDDTVLGWESLPWEVLEIIFSYVIQDDRVILTLCRLQKVCSRWRDVACRPCLWTKMDFSYGWITKLTEARIKWLCENRLSRLREVNFSTTKMLNNKWLQIIGSDCLQLEHIGLAFCTKVTSEGMKFIIDGCTKLNSLDLSHMSLDALSKPVLLSLIEKHGEQLKCLNLSGNNFKGFQKIFDMLIKSSPKLQVLQMNNVKFSSDVLTVNIEKFQGYCPKLRILELSLTSYRAPYAKPAEQAKCSGFSEMEEVSLAIDTTAYGTTGLNDDFLFRLLKGSFKLKLLDLRGSSNIQCDTIQGLPATDLEQLYISLSSVAKYSGIEIIMSKWQHSLRQLDLSWNLFPGMSLDAAVRKLSDDPSISTLEVLNLSGTSITCDRIKSILEGCPKLKQLNLCSCRGLPRGMKRDFDMIQLAHLHSDIDKILEEEGHGKPGISRKILKKYSSKTGADI